MRQFAYNISREVFDLANKYFENCVEIAIGVALHKKVGVEMEKRTVKCLRMKLDSSPMGNCSSSRPPN